jgi:glycosyltransferase involved in cell wall biosynthesis
MLAKFLRKPLLLEIRDIWPDALVDIGALRNPIAIALSRALARWMYRQATAIVINSPGFRDHLLAADVPADRIHLVPNGVDTRMFDPDFEPTPLRERLGWAGRFVVLYSGAHGMANDLDTVLDAAALLRDRPEILLAFLGDGPEKVRLKSRAQDLGLDQVAFLDACPKQEMPAMLAAADACLAHLKPSAMQAMVYPNKVFDYMAAARPTILGIGGVIRAVMDEAEGGLWVPCGDASAMAAAVRTLADDPTEGRAMGRRARAYVETHFQRQALARPLLTALRACGLDLPA